MSLIHSLVLGMSKISWALRLENSMKYLKYTMRNNLLSRTTKRLGGREGGKGWGGVGGCVGENLMLQVWVVGLQGSKLFIKVASILKCSFTVIKNYEFIKSNIKRKH